MEQTLSNKLLTVTASSVGAEPQSIRSNLTGHEYLLQGDPFYWKRRSPHSLPYSRRRVGRQRIRHESARIRKGYKFRHGCLNGDPDRFSCVQTFSRANLFIKR